MDSKTQKMKPIDSSSEDEKEPENLSYKIIVVGDPTVGKT